MNGSSGELLRIAKGLKLAATICKCRPAPTQYNPRVPVDNGACKALRWVPDAECVNELPLSRPSGRG